MLQPMPATLYPPRILLELRILGLPVSPPLDIICVASDSPVIHAQAEFAEHFTQDLIQHIHAVTPEYFEQIVADILRLSVLQPR